jgi:REP element-mobilizing transposase RayT
MPNHIHLLWHILEMNGKESPIGSFIKFTAHQFRVSLLQSDRLELAKYLSEKTDKICNLWKRDPLAIPITSEASFVQKLNYIHNNPIQPKWNLAAAPAEYRWSSAQFYELEIDEFGIVGDFRL